MAFDGLFIRHLKDLIKDDIIGSKISRIGQIDKNIYVFSLWKRKVQNLVISLEPGNCYFYLDEGKIETSSEYFHFTNVLRTHLTDGEITNIDILNNDRILIIEVKIFDEAFGYQTKYLYVELLGKFTNLILTKEDNKIIDASKKILDEGKTSQVIIPSLTYKPPFNNPKLDPYFDQTKNENYVKNYYGISPLLEREIIYRNNDFSSLINLIKTSDKIYITTKDGKSEFHFLPLLHLNYQYEEYDYKLGIKLFYKQKLKEKLFKQRTSNIIQILDNQLVKASNSLKKLEMELNSYEDKDGLKEKGDLLFTYHSLGKVNGNKFIYQDDDYDLEIEIDPLLSLIDNAKKYFKAYNKIQKALPYLNEYINSYKTKISYYENIKLQILNASSEELEEIKDELRLLNLIEKNKKNKKNKQKKFNLLTFNVDGILIEVGKNNLQNEYLTFEKAKYYETFFHVKDYPGAHVVVHSTTLNEKLIRFAANVAAYYSKAKYSSSVPVSYTLVKNVKKHPMNLPGLVILKNYKTIYIDPIDPSEK